MSYNEHMWSKSLDKTTTSTNANEFAKQDFKHISAEGFAEIYKKAFIEYINNRQSKNAVMHVEDIAIENSSFAEAFYVIAGAIYEIGK